MMERENLDPASMTLQELTQLAQTYGEKSYRAKQIFSWFHKEGVFEPVEMSNLPASLREKLTDAMGEPARLLDVQISNLDGTRKYLFELGDGNVIESVFMRYHHGNSVCISSQAGCRMGCRFCASTIGGLNRNLLPSEMLYQIYAIARHTGERVSNVVVMGTGEPLDNYDNLVRFIRLLTDENGMNLSQRNITVSTCGLVEKIRELADLKLQITLALSLHACTQEKRMELMPVARRYDLGEVMEACLYYFRQTGRRMTFEYSLVAGVNDTPEDAKRLALLLKEQHGHVNLIPVNPVRERSFRPPQRTNVLKFQKMLEKHGINVTIRREMGRDIDGACGQLRRRYLNSPEGSASLQAGNNKS